MKFSILAGGCWSLSQLHVGPGRYTPGWVASSSQGPMCTFGGFGALLKGACGVPSKLSVLCFLPHSPMTLRSSRAPPEGDASVCSGVGTSVLRAAGSWAPMLRVGVGLSEREKPCSPERRGDQLFSPEWRCVTVRGGGDQRMSAAHNFGGLSTVRVERHVYVISCLCKKGEGLA